MNWVVELEKGVWLARWTGDPGRALLKKYAKRFVDFEDAMAALSKARECREFKLAKIYVS